MFRLHHFITTCFATVALGTAAGANNEARPEIVTQITDLQPFTHLIYIPAGSDLSSIKIEEIKPVNVATKRRGITNQRYCNQPWSDPGGSMDCRRTTDESLVPAYRVTYSYRGQPMASDEYGSTHFTFSVYLRPEEITPRLREVVSSGKVKRTSAAKFFAVTTWTDSVEGMVIDEANSTICDGNYWDGNWVRTTPKCEDHVAYRKIAMPSSYITVLVDPVSSRPEVPATATGLREK